jgi:DNA-binding Lrp family transcriptional regulator
MNRMKKLKQIDFALISELIKNPTLSDRQLAKILKTSQPTITRRRTELEKQTLLDYTAIPDLKKLGYEILAFTFGKWNFTEHPTTHIEEMKTFIQQHPDIIFISTGSGSGADRMAISVHKTYSDYSKTLQQFKAGWSQYFESLSSFIVSLQADNILRNLTFKPLTEKMKQEHIEDKKWKPPTSPKNSQKT